ncbi:MAG: cell division protein FtsZ [Alphaproteobacteria bacterium]|nr:cell division protein FtsZ [Alphaproteobacteria bacterium]
MSLTLSIPQDTELRPRITVIGVGGAGGNAVNNMIQSNLEGCEFVVCNTDSQAITNSLAERKIQLGTDVTQGLGAGSRPEVGRAAAEDSLDEIINQLDGSNMVFITAGMGGGTGTGAAPVVAQAARERDILTVGVVTKPFTFEGQHRMRIAERGIEELQQYVDTLIIIPNQNLFRIASERTTFAEAFNMADDVLHSGVRGVTDLMVMPGLINLDFADVRTVMSEMGKAMMGTGEATGDKRALEAAEAAIANPLLDDMSMKGAKGLLINVTGGADMTLFEVDEACNRIRDEVDPDANIIFGATFDEKVEGSLRVSIVATGIEAAAGLERPGRPQLSVVKAKGIETNAQPAIAADTAARPMLGATAQPRVAPQHAPQHVGMTMNAGNTATAVNLDMLSLENPADDILTGQAAVDTQPDERAEASETPAEIPSEIPELLTEKGVEDAPDVAEAKAEPALEKPGAKAARPVARDAFIPPKAAMPGRDPLSRPRSGTVATPGVDPFRAADMENASRKPEADAKRTKSLFQKVTGFIGAREEEESAARPVPQPTAKPAADDAERTAQPMDQVKRPAAQPRLGGLDAHDRLATKKADDDLLEIPAFLRRQAN